MNLQDKVKRTFAEFWNIDLGHICLAVTFVFGLGLAWQKTNSRIEQIADSVQIKHESALQLIATASTERDLKMAALTERMVRDETQIAMVSDLKTAVAVIGSEMRALNMQLSGIRDELHAQVRKPE